MAPATLRQALLITIVVVAVITITSQKYRNVTQTQEIIAYIDPLWWEKIEHEKMLLDK